MALREILVDACRDNESIVDEQVDVATVGVRREILRRNGGADGTLLSA